MNQVGQVAVIGVGYWGRNIARSFAELGALGAIVDSDPATANSVAELTGAAICTLDAVLSDPAISGIAIATRAETHFALAQKALAAGKHVFVEKPLVLDQGEADLLIAQSSAAGLTLMVGHLLRYHPLFRRMLEIVQSGQYGALRYVYSDRMSLGKIRTEENVLWSFAPHDVSMVLALAGEEPTSVSAQGQAFVNSGIADYATAQLFFASGLKADIRTSWMSYKKVQQCVAICDRATIVFEDSQADWAKKLAVHPHAVVTENGFPVPKRGEMHYVDVPRAEPLKEECAHFLDCLEGSAPLTNGTEGRAVLRVLQRASEVMNAALA
jgi:predicted dehydrogenase